MEAFLGGNGRAEEEQEMLVIHVEPEQILETVGVSYPTNRERTFWLEGTTYRKDLRNHVVKLEGVLQGGEIMLKGQQQVTRKHTGNRDPGKKFIQGNCMSCFEFKKGSQVEWRSGQKGTKYGDRKPG